MKHLCFLFLLSSVAFGQGIIVPTQQALKVVNGITSPVANATITVCAANASGIPCTPVLTSALFKDAALTQPLSNPFTSDANGNYVFAIAPGNYTVTVTAATFAGYSYQTTAPLAAGAANTFTQTNTFTGATNLNGGGALSGTFGGPATFSGSNTFSGNNTFSGSNSAKQINNVIMVDGATYTGAQALQSAIQACSGFPSGCNVDARNPNIGTQTFTVNPFSGLNMPIYLSTGPYTVQWDHAALFVDHPSHFRWELNSTVVLNSSGSTGAGTSAAPTLIGANCFFCSRFYSTTGSITSATNSLTVASTANLNVGDLVLTVGALGGNGNQQTTTNGATGTGASFTVTSTTGWDVTGAKVNYLLIDSEEMVCTGGTATTFTGCTRGINGTTAVSHNTAVNVQATANLLSRVLAISGSIVTLEKNASFTVTSAPVYFGVIDASIEGTGVFDGFQTVAQPMRFLGGYMGVLSTNVTIGPGITFKRWDLSGMLLIASWDNFILARHYEGDGKPPTAVGWDIGVFESSSYNHISTASQSNGVDAVGANAGDLGLFVDDRSVNTTIFDGPPTGNIIDLGSIGVAGPGYTQGVIVQSGSKGNVVHASYIHLAAGTGNGIELNFDGDWTSTVFPLGNVITFGTVDATGANAITAGLGYSGSNGQNRIIGGFVLGGVVSTLAGDYAEFMGNNGVRTISGNSKENSFSMARSAGGLGFPDIFGNGAARLMLGDSNGVGIGTAGATFTLPGATSGTATLAATATGGNLSVNGSQVGTIASGTATMTTAAIAAGACGTTVTVAAANVATTDTITWAFNAAPGGQNAGLVAWPTSGNVNFAYCSNTAETPAAATINWRVVR